MSDNSEVSGSSSSAITNEVAAFEETRGPLVGIHLTQEQANIILLRHLACTCTALEYIDGGYNNRAYIAHASNGNEYVIRLCGRYWDRWKTEREVATLCFIRLRCLDFPVVDPDNVSVPVPLVYGFCSNREASRVGHEYILMERIPGLSLQKVWKSKVSTTAAEKEFFFAQLAAIIRTMQSFTFDKIGSLRFAPWIGDTYGIGIGIRPLIDITLDDIHVGQQSDIMAGPFDNYIEYERAATLSAIADLKTIPYMAEYLDMLPRIEEYVQTKLRSDSSLFQDKTLVQPPISLLHLDLDQQNIIVNPDTFQITGIVDWEWAGALPTHEDWLWGYETFGSMYSADWMLDKSMLQSVQRQKEMDNDNTEYDPHSPEMIENREIFFAQLKAHGVSLPTPDEINGLQLYAELWYFRNSICPWWVREADDVIPMPTHREQEKTRGRARIEYVLDKYLT